MSVGRVVVEEGEEENVGGNREGSGKRGKEEEERGDIAATGKTTVCLLSVGRVSFLDLSFPGNQLGD